MPTLEQAQTWYDPRDPVHGFDHVLRVLRTAEWLARAYDADLAIVRAAALLHDVEGAAPGSGSSRTAHEQASAEFARGVLAAEGWADDRVEAVVHCIQTHRYRGEAAPQTLEAQILFDADKLDVVGAFGVARTIGYALQAGQPLFSEPSAAFREGGEGEPGEPHSAYHEYEFKLRHIPDLLHTPLARRLGAARARTLELFFAQLAEEARGADLPTE